MNKTRPEFLQGFVERCLEADLPLEETCELWSKHSYASLLARPSVQEGFVEGMREKMASVAPSALMRAMSPELLAKAFETVLHYGDTPLAKLAREELEIESDARQLPDSVKQAAATLNNIFGQYHALPLSQQIMLASVLGGGLGGAWRSLMPSDEDQLEQRGLFNRALRGVMRGGAAGAGAAAGSAAGNELVGRFDPASRGAGSILGGVLGGLAGRRLMGDAVA